MRRMNRKHSPSPPPALRRRSRRGAALALALTAVIALGASGCILTSEASCTGACEKVVSCEGLEKEFLLNCAPFTGCYGAYVICAECIELTGCEGLIAGECDPVCVP